MWMNVYGVRIIFFWLNDIFKFVNSFNNIGLIIFIFQVIVIIYILKYKEKYMNENGMCYWLDRELNINCFL